MSTVISKSIRLIQWSESCPLLTWSPLRQLWLLRVDQTLYLSFRNSLWHISGIWRSCSFLCVGSIRYYTQYTCCYFHFLEKTTWGHFLKNTFLKLCVDSVSSVSVTHGLCFWVSGFSGVKFITSNIRLSRARHPPPPPQTFGEAIQKHPQRQRYEVTVPHLARAEWSQRVWLDVSVDVEVKG